MMKKNVLIFAGIIISHCLCPAMATTYYVNPGQSIQTAIDSASYFDTVQVAPGTYIENITLKKGVALIGAGASSTIIDANSVDTTVKSSFCDPNTRLTCFTITGGDARYGGGMYNVYSHVIITNCVFIANNASYGGAMRNLTSDPNIINCIFIGNSAADRGGAIHNVYDSRPTITNCTFAHNSADTGGVMRNHNSEPKITNCILWQNTAPTGPEISNLDCSPVISHSDIQGCGSSAAWDASFGTDAGGNLDRDPMFERNPNDGGDGWGDDPCTPADESANDDYGDLHLLAGSPCIDAGDNSALIANPLDLEGNPRIANVVVDIGAYERPCPCSIIGDFDCSCGVDGVDFAMLTLTWLTGPADPAYKQACDISRPGDDLVDIEDVKVLAENWLQGF
jgi:predicted outer membrane repeat protein